MKWSMLYFWHISLDHFWWLLRMTRLGAWLQLKCSWVHLGLFMSKLRKVFEVESWFDFKFYNLDNYLSYIGSTFKNQENNIK
jgi:hypothetical protein